MQEGAMGLARLVDRVDLLATSPLTRAVETAAIVQQALGAPAPLTLPALVPDAPVEALADWLSAAPSDATIAVVGHEPHLSTFVTWLLAGHEGGVIELKKGAAACLELSHPVQPGRAVLRWLCQPRQLRRIGA